MKRFSLHPHFLTAGIAVPGKNTKKHVKFSNFKQHFLKLSTQLSRANCLTACLNSCLAGLLLMLFASCSFFSLSDNIVISFPKECSSGYAGISLNKWHVYWLGSDGNIESAVIDTGGRLCRGSMGHCSLGGSSLSVLGAADGRAGGTGISNAGISDGSCIGRICPMDGSCIEHTSGPVDGIAIRGTGIGRVSASGGLLECSSCSGAGRACGPVHESGIFRGIPAGDGSSGGLAGVSPMDDSCIGYICPVAGTAIIRTGSSTSFPDIALTVPREQPIIAAAYPVTGGNFALKPAGCVISALERAGNNSAFSLSWTDGFAAEFLLKLASGGVSPSIVNIERLRREAVLKSNGNPWNLNQLKLSENVCSGKLSTRSFRLNPAHKVTLNLPSGNWYSDFPPAPDLISSPGTEKWSGFLTEGLHSFYCPGSRQTAFISVDKTGNTVIQVMANTN